MHPTDADSTPEPVIAEAVGASAAARDPSRAKRLEAAMAAAIQDAIAEGISLEDSDAIRARMMAARQFVLDKERSS